MPLSRQHHKRGISFFVGETSRVVLTASLLSVSHHIVSGKPADEPRLMGPIVGEYLHSLFEITPSRKSTKCEQENVLCKFLVA
jgi:hypothetical protein